MFYWVARGVCAVFCKVFLRQRAYGREMVPKKGGFILAGNHASYLDPVVFGVACPRGLNYLARDTLFRNRFFGWLICSVHTIPLKRDAADLGAIKEGIKRLKHGQGLLLFPEGTRSVDGVLQKGRHGVGFLARKSGVPVVPAYCHGTFEAWPKGAKTFKPTPVVVRFGAPVIFNDKSGLSDQEIADRIMEEIKRLKDSVSR